MFEIGYFLEDIKPIISKVIIPLSYGVGAFCFLFFVVNKKNSFNSRLAVGIVVLIFVVFNITFTYYVSRPSTWAYILYYKPEITEIRNILYNKGNFSSKGGRNSQNSVTTDEVKRILYLKEKMDFKSVYTDSNKVCFNLYDNYVMMYSDLPIEDALNETYNRNSPFSTYKLFGHWYYFYLLS